ncbi:MAG TPA: alpha-amylase family glycosyl hydrolase, partial [Geobacteraceae bacterium]
MDRVVPRQEYFPFALHLRGAVLDRLDLTDKAREIRRFDRPQVVFHREVASRFSHQSHRAGTPVSAGLLNLYALQLTVFRHLVYGYLAGQEAGLLTQALTAAGFPCGSQLLTSVAERFCSLYPGTPQLAEPAVAPGDWLAADDPTASRQQTMAVELMLLALGAENRALDPFRELIDDTELALTSSYRRLVTRLEGALAEAPPVAAIGLSLPELLRAPLKAAPDSLYGQLAYMRSHWQAALPPELFSAIGSAFVVMEEEGRLFSPAGDMGPAPVLEFGHGGVAGTNDYYPEPEQFSADTHWMPNVVLLAKMVYVWLGQLSRQYGQEISRLDQIPDAELDRLARWGFTGLWLIGLWERSPASQQIKQITGNPEAISSAYSLFDYTIAEDLGGEAALWDLRNRALKRGIRLASDMVPNHTGLYSRWTIEHP